MNVKAWTKWIFTLLLSRVVSTSERSNTKGKAKKKSFYVIITIGEVRVQEALKVGQSK